MYGKVFDAPPGAAENEIEQFWRMEMVDMVITIILLSYQKSRSVNNLLQQSDSGRRWDSTPRVSRPEKVNPPPRADFLILPSG